MFIRFYIAVHFLLLSHDGTVASAASQLRLRRHEARELDTRIIGGTEATEDRHPYAVSLRNEYGHFCGGSLITKDVVLTAAHCQTGSYYVVVGQHDMDEYYDGEGLYVKANVPHPSYDTMTSDKDFMLVFLDGAADNVNVVRLNSDSSVPAVGQEVTVMGWGDVVAADAVSELSDVLKSVNVNVISNEQCEVSEGVIDGYYTSYNDQITESMLCAEGYQSDSCQGDSGGPLIVKGGDAGSDVQVGIVSWGAGCASADFPGIYARISQVYDWIENEVCSYSSFASEAGFNCGSVSSGNGDDSAGGIVDDTPSGTDGDEGPIVSNTGEDDDWWSFTGGGSGSSNNDVLPDTDDFFDFIYGLLGDGPI